MSDKYVLATDDNGNLAVRTVTAEESPTANSTDVITATTDGKLAVRVVGASGGGGGGDQHNLGWYATESALTTAHPTATAGDWAIVGSTDTVWIWDTDNEEWVDSDQKGQVTSVNGQTGDVVLDLLPDQTGQSGKFLTTDGTDASWTDSVSKSTVPLSLQTTSSGGTMFTLKNNMGRALNFVAVGTSGFKISAYGQVEIDKNFLPSSDNSTTLGYRYSSNAPICWSCVFTKKISSSVYPNDIVVPEVAGTMAVIQVNTTATLTSAGWSGGSQTITVNGVTATGIVFVSPDPTDQADYVAGGILCTAQAANSLTFTASTTPTNDIDVVVVAM